jgi:hypothetical protein
VSVDLRLEDAWAQVYAVLPAEWSVSQPMHRPELGYRVAYCRDTRYRKKKGTPQFVEAAAPTEEAALRELARCIVEVSEGRVPK